MINEKLDKPTKNNQLCCKPWNVKKKVLNETLTATVQPAYDDDDDDDDDGDDTFMKDSKL